MDFTRITTDKIDFSNAPLFKRTAVLHADDIKIATGGETITTYQAPPNVERFIETVKTAQAGDIIITRDEHDIRIMDREKFHLLYAQKPDNKNIYVSHNKGRAYFLRHDTVIFAPWGHDQYIKAGGVLFNNETEIYGNQAHSFEGDFARLANNGDIMPLSQSLSTQREWAQDLGETSHLEDILKRMDFMAR